MSVVSLLGRGETWLDLRKPNGLLSFPLKLRSAMSKKDGNEIRLPTPDQHQMEQYFADIFPEQGLINLLCAALRESEPDRRAEALIALANHAINMSDAALGSQGSIVTSLQLQRH